MKAVDKKLAFALPTLSEGSFTRAEAGTLIAQGSHHVHSHPKLQGPGKDGLVALTEKAIQTGTIPQYPWELPTAQVLHLTCSKARNEILTKILAGRKNIKREMGANINMVFEELATNAIYHSYQTKVGKDKYSRTQPALLSEKEKVSVYFAWENNGLYLALEDKGGTLSFDRIQEVFHRCYLGDQKNKIENKEGGAGLGLYMVFEAVTHLKLSITPGVSTVVSCWLQEKSRHVEESFSFNFFIRKEQP